MRMSIKPAVKDVGWQGLLSGGITRFADFPSRLKPDRDAVEAVRSVYPMTINAYYAGLIADAGDAVGRQVIPDGSELDDQGLTDDPLTENRQSPVPGIIHRYPDRVVFLVSSRCPILCRFCMRKRLAGRAAPLTADEMTAAIDYIRRRPAIREVILSGGDPLMLEDRQLDQILTTVRGVAHVDIVRIHSRTPCALPQRITTGLVAILKKYHPLFVNIHFNHPDEITPTAARACSRLAAAGIPLGSQTVLLKGINDSADVLGRLFRELLRLRVRPYYLHHPDLVGGTAHFRVPVSRGLAIIGALQGRLSGMAMPRYMIDLPGGGGKVPLLPEQVQDTADGMLLVKNFNGDLFRYPLDA